MYTEVVEPSYISLRDAISGMAYKHRVPRGLEHEIPESAIGLARGSYSLAIDTLGINSAVVLLNKKHKAAIALHIGVKDFRAPLTNRSIRLDSILQSLSDATKKFAEVPEWNFVSFSGLPASTDKNSQEIIRKEQLAPVFNRLRFLHAHEVRQMICATNERYSLRIRPEIADVRALRYSLAGELLGEPYHYIDSQDLGTGDL